MVTHIFVQAVADQGKAKKHFSWKHRAYQLVQTKDDSIFLQTLMEMVTSMNYYACEGTILSLWEFFLLVVISSS